MGQLMWVEPAEPDIGLFGIILGKMAYPFMFIITGAMCLSHKSLQNVIPGHPILSFLVLAFGAMVLTFLIMRLVLIGAAFSALCCMMILHIVYEMILNALRPDSVQYYILITVIFSAISLLLCYLNLCSDWGCIHIRGLSCILAGILNALTAAQYILIIRVTWEDYCSPQGSLVIEDKILYDSFLGDTFGAPRGFASVPGAVVFYIVFAAICLGAFAATIIFRNELTK